jgi:hypothetical protein
MVRLVKFISVLIAACGLLAAESRFGLPVANLETPKSFQFLELTENKFAMNQKSGLVVGTVVYGGPWRYFVDVAVSNRGSEPVTLAPDFVRFHKNGTAVAFSNTPMVAAELQRALDQTSVAAAPKVSAATFAGNVQVIQQRAAMEKERAQKQSLIAHVSTFAHEKQSLELAPGKMTLYTFVFQAPDRDKMGFEMCVYAGDDEFKYEFKK